MRALVTDDSPFVRDLIRYHLERIGCEVIANASNAAMALDLLEIVEPDFLTLDLVMPERDGIDASTAFRTIRKKYAALPIVVISSVSFEKTRKAFLREGALDYVIKPFTRYSFEPVLFKLARVFPELQKPAPQIDHQRRARVSNAW